MSASLCMSETPHVSRDLRYQRCSAAQSERHIEVLHNCIAELRHFNRSVLDENTHLCEQVVCVRQPNMDDPGAFGDPQDNEGLNEPAEYQRLHSIGFHNRRQNPGKSVMQFGAALQEHLAQAVPELDQTVKGIFL